MLNFSFPTADEILTASPPARRAIADGNYELAAKLAGIEGDAELAAIAVIMAGGVRVGLERLEKQSPCFPESPLYAAFGHWCLGKTDTALRYLDAISEPEIAELAHGLRAWIERETINVVVLADANNRRGAPLSPGNGFSVRHIASTGERDALLSEHDDGLRGCDLVLAYDSANEALLDAATRQGAQTAIPSIDFDQRFAELHPLFERANVIVGSTAMEHHLLSKIFNSRVTAYPAMPIREHRGAMVPLKADKNIDVFYSGVAFTPHWADRARTLYRIAMLDDFNINIRIHDGYRADALYRQDMARAKYVPLINRMGFSVHQDRTIDALHFGTSGLAIGGVEADWILGEAGRRLPALALHRIEADLPKIVASYDNAVASINWTECRAVVEDFYPAQPDRDARTLKFILFQTLFAKNRPVPTTAQSPEKKAPRAHFASKSAAKISEFMRSPTDTSTINSTLDALQREIDNASEAIAPIFNKARILWLIGRRMEAVPLFHKIKDMPAQTSSLLRIDNLLPHRMRDLSRFMPYQAYFQAIVLDHADGDPRLPRAHAVIVATSLTYLALDHCLNERFAEGAQAAAQALDLCDQHHPAAWQLTKAAFAAGWPTERILQAFVTATELYPPLMDELLPFGIDALERQGMHDLAETYVRKWVYAQSRITYSDPMSGRPPQQTLACAMRYLARLPDTLKVVLKELAPA